MNGVRPAPVRAQLEPRVVGIRASELIQHAKSLLLEGGNAASRQRPQCPPRRADSLASSRFSPRSGGTPPACQNAPEAVRYGCLQLDTRNAAATIPHLTYTSTGASGLGVIRP
jgi:hypothetical protein